ATDAFALRSGGDVHADLGSGVVRGTASVERRQIRRGDDLTIELGHPNRTLVAIELPKPLDAVFNGDWPRVGGRPAGGNRLVIDIDDRRQVIFDGVANHQIHRMRRTDVDLRIVIR